MAQWTNEKILNFINEIRVRPELWDVKASAYKDRKFKKDTWAVIATKFDVTTEEAYKKFRNLRTYAQTEFKKKKSGSGTGKKVTWFAFEAISFVLSRDNPDTGTDSETNTLETTICEETDDDEMFNSDETSDSLIAPPPPKNSRNKTNSNRFNKNNSSQTIDTTYENAAQIINSSGKEKNPYSGFGEHIAYKLTTYDSYTRAQVEFKISEILYNADMGRFQNAPDVAGSSNQTTQDSPQRDVMQNIGTSDSSVKSELT